MYDTPNSLISYRVVPMNIILPTFTRGPGKSPGSFALESAIDELAYKLKIDPIEFRIKNEPAKDPSNGKPWSSRKIVECLQKGAKAFGWNKRKIGTASKSAGKLFNRLRRGLRNLSGAPARHFGDCKIDAQTATMSQRASSLPPRIWERERTRFSRRPPPSVWVCPFEKSASKSAIRACRPPPVRSVRSARRVLPTPSMTPA